MGAGNFFGTITFIGAAENVGKKKPFYKRIFVVDDSSDERYPNPCPFELTRDNLSLIDKFEVGDEVRVSYYLNGRAWENPNTHKTAHFLTANAVAVTPIDGASEGGTNAETDMDAIAEEAGASEGDPNALPF